MAEPAPSASRRIAGYELLRLHGRGGMGEVYEARDRALERRVALKVLAEHLVGDASAATRFQREITLAARVEHVGIVPVYTAGVDAASGRVYIATRFVDGPNLQTQVRVNGPLKPSDATTVLGQLGSALQAVHDAGLVHRDVKPHNVLLWAPGARDQHALLTDFGIASAVHDTGHLTRAGAIVGSPAYMAPELWRGEPATPASDQYALACVAQFILTGRGPFDTLSDAWPRRHLEGVPEPLPSAAAPATQRAIARALSKRPADRFSSVRAFLDQLGAAAAFDRAEAVTQVLRAGTDETVTHALTEQYALTEPTVALLTDRAPSEIIRERRLAARRAIMGGD
ncbi:serine/threonine-protein kinase [Solirubrobacter pauli]|uniref:non-specific serine/threonine protein kinase n=1 Tax=Solirubrobacter pauli TaxID=166793 RepID=A0A660L746_9ACTN|nr:serine/threonine-protein kinase [Solirubrobacter pauli]RKQ90878.1 serine/threonine-protein kinase [Solirubrobacter pauli]